MPSSCQDYFLITQIIQRTDLGNYLRMNTEGANAVKS